MWKHTWVIHEQASLRRVRLVDSKVLSCAYNFSETEHVMSLYESQESRLKQGLLNIGQSYTACSDVNLRFHGSYYINRILSHEHKTSV